MKCRIGTLSHRSSQKPNLGLTSVPERYPSDLTSKVRTVTRIYAFRTKVTLFDPHDRSSVEKRWKSPSAADSKFTFSHGLSVQRKRSLRLLELQIGVGAFGCLNEEGFQRVDSARGRAEKRIFLRIHMSRNVLLVPALAPLRHTKLNGFESDPVPHSMRASTAARGKSTWILR